MKLFSPWAWRAWSLTSLEPDEPDLAYGLFDGEDGVPHVGHVRLKVSKNWKRTVLPSGGACIGSLLYVHAMHDPL